MVAVPVLAGALLRVVIGVLVDPSQPKATGLIGASRSSSSASDHGLALGVNSFAEILLPRHRAGRRRRVRSRSRCRSPRAGIRPNIRARAWGSPARVIRAPCLRRCSPPGLAVAFGWLNVLGLAAMPLTARADRLHPAAAKDSPDPRRPRACSQYLSVLRTGDAWWFMFFYAVTFGGFVGLASSLTIYFNADYGLSPGHRRLLHRRLPCSPARWCGRWAVRSPIASAAFARCRSCTSWLPPRS